VEAVQNNPHAGPDEGFGAKDAAGDPKPQMLKQRVAIRAKLPEKADQGFFFMPGR
jgi:hypothetical protein